jgi:hypothetical protein
VTPAGANSLAVLRIDHADSAMPQRDFASARNRLDSYFHMVVGGVRHEHRATQLKQRRSLDDLDESPQVPNPVAAVAVPSPARFRLQQQIQRRAIGCAVAFSEPVQNGGESLFRGGFDFYVLFNVEQQVVESRAGFSSKLVLVSPRYVSKY